MKKLALSIVIMFFAVALFAENEKEKTEVKANNELAVVDLSGTVTDSGTGELLVGVEVCIKGTDMKTYTDFDGRFTFQNVKKGNYDIVSSYISYEKQLMKNVNADQTKNQVEIKLEASN